MKRRKQHIEDVTRIKYEFGQELLKTQLEIQEQTLKTISQEIHDNIGQVLSLAKLNLSTMSAEKPEELQQKIFNSKELVSKAITDLRGLSKSLDTDYVADMGLQRAIEYEMEMIGKSASIETQLQIEGTAFRMDRQKELILFRIVQETFNNIIKHAGAKKIAVTIHYKPEALEVKLTDDGKGIDLEPLNDKSNTTFGLGIRNMNSRAKLIGADFNMHSTVGEGTEVTINLPKENNHYENKS